MYHNIYHILEAQGRLCGGLAGGCGLAAALETLFYPKRFEAAVAPQRRRRESSKRVERFPTLVGSSVRDITPALSSRDGVEQRNTITPLLRAC